MVKTTLEIKGMACSMCEAHMNETIRKAVPGARKVTSSHVKGTAQFLSDEAPREDALKEAIAQTGYEMTGFKTEPVEKEKKGFHFFGR